MLRRFSSLIFLMVIGCDAAEPLSQVDRLELRQSGGSAIDVEIDRRGQGTYKLFDPPNSEEGSFSITLQQKAALLRRLEPFQQAAEPMTDESIQRAIEARCPKGVQSVTDAGGFWVHWVGEDYDRHYFADFGCDYERNRARNDELREVLRSLPISLPR